MNKEKFIEKLPIQALIPLIEMCKSYFDNKFPCDKDDNCGDDMSLEDVWKKKIYDKLLYLYHNDKNDIDRITNDLYTELKQLAKIHG